MTTWAVEIKPRATVAMQYTDNVKKVTDGKKSDLIAMTSIGTSIDTGQAPFQFNADASLNYSSYTENTYGDQQDFNLKATVDWEMIKEQVDWKLQNFFTQQSIDALKPDTPDNIQDTNVLTFGPVVQYPISGRQLIMLKPEYRNFTYSSHNIDNHQEALDGHWNYQLFRTVNVGVRGGVNKVDYKAQQLTDLISSNLHLTFLSKRADYRYSADIGLSNIDREGGESVRGTTGNIRWLFNLTGVSKLRAYIASNITDTSNSLLQTSVNPDYGWFSNEQITAEVLRNSIVRLSYQREGASLLTSNVWIELRNQDYEFALLDRTVKSLGIDLNFPINPLLFMGVTTNYSHIELTDSGRKDIKHSLGGNLNYRFSRRLLGVIDLKFSDKSSSVDTDEFSEFNLLASLTYHFNP